MSFDKMLREAVREEVAKMLAPINTAVAQLQSQGAVVARLAAVLGTPLKRGPGRPAKLPLLTAGRKAKGSGASEGARLCAVEGCGRPARSKGYCAAHYQKYRMLEKTGRLPSDWVEYAPEGSVKNVTLPRGRAGAKALAEAKRRSKS